MSCTVEISPAPADLTFSELCAFLRVDEQDVKNFKLVDGNAVVLFKTSIKAKAVTLLSGVKLRGVSVRINPVDDEDYNFEDYNILPESPQEKEVPQPQSVEKSPKPVEKEKARAHDILQKTSVGARRALDENDPFGIAFNGKVSSALSLITLTILTLSTIFG
jgi:hypothetical protein